MSTTQDSGIPVATAPGDPVTPAPGVAVTPAREGEADTRRIGTGATGAVRTPAAGSSGVDRDDSGERTVAAAGDTEAAGRARSGTSVATPTDPVVLRAEIAETRAALAETVALLAARTDVKARAKERTAEIVAAAKGRAQDRTAEIMGAAKGRAQDARASVGTLSHRVAAAMPSPGGAPAPAGVIDDPGVLSGEPAGWRVHPMVLPSVLLGIAGGLFGAAAVVARRSRR